MATAGGYVQPPGWSALVRQAIVSGAGSASSADGGHCSAAKYRACGRPGACRKMRRGRPAAPCGDRVNTAVLARRRPRRPLLTRRAAVDVAIAAGAAARVDALSFAARWSACRKRV